MKKIMILFLLLISICSCSNNSNVPKYPYEIVSHRVDMSAYNGVSSTKHNFEGIGVSELFNCIDNKSSGVFYLGRDNCGCCQQVCRYLNETAQELGVTIYYIDVYDENEPLTDEAIQQKLTDYLYDILSEREGERVLLTPHVFSIINGEFYKSQICYDGIEFSNDPTDRQIETLKGIYRDIMLPFSTSKSE